MLWIKKIYVRSFFTLPIILKQYDMFSLSFSQFFFMKIISSMQCRWVDVDLILHRVPIPGWANIRNSLLFIWFLLALLILNEMNQFITVSNWSWKRIKINNAELYRPVKYFCCTKRWTTLWNLIGIPNKLKIKIVICARSTIVVVVCKWFSSIHP